VYFSRAAGGISANFNSGSGGISMRAVSARSA
jgi:hypothetical protein